jgi:hypothetical protein
MARTRYASDPGLIARMGATMFLMGLLFVGFGAATRMPTATVARQAPMS